MKNPAIRIVRDARRSPKRIKWLELAVLARQLPSYRRVELTPKLWLQPNGRLVSLGGEQHDTWLQAHRDVAKRFGLTAAELRRDHQGVRMAALRKGFIRVAYERGAGRLALEGMSKFWTGNVKSTLFMLIADNIGMIDQVAVNLFSDRGTLLVSKSASLFRYADNEKLERIPLISEALRLNITARKSLR
jgi:hypothetical protein